MRENHYAQISPFVSVSSGAKQRETTFGNLLTYICSCSLGDLPHLGGNSRVLVHDSESRSLELDSQTFPFEKQGGDKINNFLSKLSILDVW